MESFQPLIKKESEPINYVTHKYTVYDSEDDVFWVKYSPKGNNIAYAWGDGKVRIFNRPTQKIQELLANPKADILDQMPITCLRWRNDNKVLVWSSADGRIYYWHAKSRKLIYTLKEEENQINWIDYDSSCSMLATAGKDFKIRLYDEDTKTLLHTLQRGGEKHSGHSNRIFWLKFHPSNSNLLLSGGWDNVVYVWDTRDYKPVNHFLGPNIWGESIDIDGDKILAGSFNDEQNLMIFDLRKIKDPIYPKWFDPNEKIDPSTSPACLYSAMYSRPSNKYIIAGGASRNEVRVLYSDNSNNYKFVSKIENMCSPCLSIDWHEDGNEFVIGLADGSLHIMGLHQKK